MYFTVCCHSPVCTRIDFSDSFYHWATRIDRSILNRHDYTQCGTLYPYAQAPERFFVTDDGCKVLLYSVWGLVPMLKLLSVFFVVNNGWKVSLN